MKKQIPSIILLCTVLAVQWLLAGTASATLRFWSFSVSDNWFNGGAWSGASNVPPTASDDARINNGGTALIFSPGAVVNNVDLGTSSGSSGNLLVSGGSLATSGFLTVGNGGLGVLTIQNGGVVNVGGLSHTILANNLGATGTLNIGAFSGGTTAGVLNAATIIGGGTAIINFNQTNSTTFTTQINGSIAVNQRGTGTTVLTGTNNYSGATTVSGGTLQINANNALGNNTAGTSVSSGAALNLDGVNYSTAEALSINGTGISNGGALVNSGTSTYAGQITAATNAAISAGGGTLNLSGGLVKDGTTLTIMGGGRVNVTGTGISGASANSDLLVDGTTLVVGTASNYIGPTTVQNSGTFVANAAITTTAVTVNSNSTLSGTGSIQNGAGLVTMNGALIVGDSTLGSPVVTQFEIGGTGIVALAATSSLYFDIFTGAGLGDSTAIAAAADRLKLFGTLDNTLGGTLVVGNPAAMTGFLYGDKWLLADLTSGGSITGPFTLDYTSLGLGGGLIASFDNGTGVLSIVPEPSHALLLVVGLMGALLRRRRK